MNLQINYPHGDVGRLDPKATGSGMTIEEKWRTSMHRLHTVDAENTRARYEIGRLFSVTPPIIEYHSMFTMFT